MANIEKLQFSAFKDYRG